MQVATNHGLKRSLDEGIVYGHSPIMQSLNAMVSDIARSDIPILLAGESGTGKEVYARLIHRVSGLSEGRLRKVCCAALDAGRILAQVRDEFLSDTGEEKAEAGTVFLDGVHELDAACQRALLSLLPDGESRIRGAKSKIRFISTTSCDLEREIEAGRFRRELYFRIGGVTLRLPPLRERKEDIPALLEYFMAQHSADLKKEIPELSGDVCERLVSYPWPGNIRELEHVAKKIVAVGGSMLALSDLRANSASMAMPRESGGVSSLKAAARAASRRAERELILKALEQTHWNRKRAARELQISYKSLLYKIKLIDVKEPASREL